MNSKCFESLIQYIERDEQDFYIAPEGGRMYFIWEKNNLLIELIRWSKPWSTCGSE